MFAALVLAAALDNAEAIRRVAPEEARTGREVAIHGVVTAVSGWKNSFFVQDETAGISVDRDDPEPAVRPGDAVTVKGVTGPGLFAPVVVAREVRVTGRRSLPKAPSFRFDELMGGAQDSQWVELRGVVRAAQVADSWGHAALFLDVDVNGGTVSARVRAFEAGEAGTLVDAEVRVRGVCGTAFNDRQQLVGLRLFVNELRDVEVLTPAPQDPWALPPQSPDSLMRFGARRAANHRIRVQGTVTQQRPGRSLYVQGGDQGVYVQTDQDTRVDPGTEVDVIGFSAPGAYSPALEAAEFRVIGPHAPPRPVRVDAAAVIRTSPEGFPVTPYDGRLVTVEGTLIARVPGTEDELLLLQQGHTLFRARLLSANGAALADVETGSALDLTGVCAVRTDRLREPKSFELQLRTPRDVVLRRAPGFWTTSRTLRILAIAVGGVLSALAWVVLLRRRVHTQTRVIREQVGALTEREAELQRAQEELRASLAREQDAAREDFLTRLRNRRAFSEAGEDEMRRSQRYPRPMALAYIDLDNFKGVNDGLGHEAGDALLQTVGAVMRETLRATDVCARLGGDEFAVLLPETDAAAARAVLEKLRGALLEAMTRHAWPVTFSIGAVVLPRPRGSFDDLVRDADKRMYEVKAGGKNRLSLVELG